MGCRNDREIVLVFEQDIDGAPDQLVRLSRQATSHIEPLDRKIGVDGDDGIGRRVDDRAVARILPLAQHPLARHRDGDVVDLQQALLCRPAAIGRMIVVQQLFPVSSRSARLVHECVRCWKNRR